MNNNIQFPPLPKAMPPGAADGSRPHGGGSRGPLRCGRLPPGRRATPGPGGGPLRCRQTPHQALLTVVGPIRKVSSYIKYVILYNEYYPLPVKLLICVCIANQPLNLRLRFLKHAGICLKFVFFVAVEALIPKGAYGLWDHFRFWVVK